MEGTVNVKQGSFNARVTLLMTHPGCAGCGFFRGTLKDVNGGIIAGGAGQAHPTGAPVVGAITPAAVSSYRTPGSRQQSINGEASTGYSVSLNLLDMLNLFLP